MSFVGVCVWFFLRACGNGVPTCATYRHSDDELRVPVHPRVAACVCIYCIESASRKEAAFRPSLALIWSPLMFGNSATRLSCLIFGYEAMLHNPVFIVNTAGMLVVLT